MIIHTAAFKTKYPDGSESLEQFLQQASQLGEISYVKNFKILPQVSAKSDYQYALYMEFSSQDAYDSYNAHPAHVRFVEEQWLVHVENFIELDYLTS